MSGIEGQNRRAHPGWPFEAVRQEDQEFKIPHHGVPTVLPVVPTDHTVTITNAEPTIARLRGNAVKAPFGVHAPAAQVPTETPALVNESAKSST